MTYQHAEAFCLMLYQSDDGTEEETIWNSRDGVTPFVISLRSGKQAKHVQWGRDRREPDYKPKPGERIFVDLTEERRQELTLRNCKRYWPNALGITEYDRDRQIVMDAQSRWGSPEAMARDLTSEPMRPGEPDLIEVKK